MIASAGGGDDGGTRKRGGVAQTRPVVTDGAALPPFAVGESDPAVGAAAPEVRGQSFDGTRVVIMADGRPKVVFFVAHWCPHCQAEFPAVADWIAERGRPEAVDVYVVSTSVSDDRPNFPPSKWIAREGLGLPTLADDADSSAADAFGLTGLPYFVAIDADNHVVTRATGEMPVAALERLIEAARTGTGSS
jgi:thiol-disulfide isomerase/thioredoxin